MALKRAYVASIAGGTATATIQMQENGTISQVCMSAVDAAAGSWEFSLSSSSQIATAQPDNNVVARTRLSGTAGRQFAVFDNLKVPVKAFQNVYLHCTGAGNVGELTLM